MTTAPKTTNKRQRVQRVSDWDDARWSNTSARAADDMRLTGVHFRLLAYLGRVNTAYGWCELSQKAVSERWGYARTSVNEAIRDLVAWGYIEKRGQSETNTALCAYRVLIDAAETDDADGDVAADVSAIDDTPPGGDVSAIGDTRVGSDPTHVSAHRTQLLEQRSKITSPLPPQAGDSADSGFENQAERANAAAKAATALAKVRRALPLATAIDGLLAPLVAQRRFSAPDHEAAFREILSHAADLPAAHLAKVLEIVLAAGVKTIKPQRVVDAIDAVRKGGLMLVVVRGSAEFAAWLRHYERTQPNIGSLMARADRWQVPASFPPNREAAA